MTTIGPAPELDVEAMEAARARWATRAKPPGALGALEDVAVHLAGVTGRCPPVVPRRPAIGLFAGDHGVVADGASAWPSDVTAAMVATIASGGAAINAFARSIGADVTVVDVGVAGDPIGLAGVLDRRVRPGTASIAREPAMTIDEAGRALAVGGELADRLVDDGADCLIGGEMGIGNTTPSAALIAACTDRPAGTVVGPGAGEPAGGLAAKRALVEAALTRVGGGPLTGAGPRVADPLVLVAEIGGLEIAALAGFY
jgi:nicotinate-nucleotide--dimethylbenzimidazole phosphoribosyltransferase